MNMFHRLPAALAVAFLAGVASSSGALAQAAQGKVYTLGSLTIAEPWTRATPKGAPVAGGYLSITNTGAAPDRLRGGAFALSGRVEVHAMEMDGSVMRMRELPDGLEIKPGQTVELKPGGYHLMFVDLKAPVTAGKPVKGALTFEKAGSIDVEFAVAPIGASAPPKGAGHGAGHGGGHGGGHGAGHAH